MVKKAIAFGEKLLRKVSLPVLTLAFFAEVALSFAYGSRFSESLRPIFAIFIITSLTNLIAFTFDAFWKWYHHKPLSYYSIINGCSGLYQIIFVAGILVGRLPYMTLAIWVCWALILPEIYQIIMPKRSA